MTIVCNYNPAKAYQFIHGFLVYRSRFTDNDLKLIIQPYLTN
ncbi:hypothetical protein ACJJTF_16355 [Bacillus velezensis]|nr:hypothetical protein [Bacillus velezensis]